MNTLQHWLYLQRGTKGGLQNCVIFKYFIKMVLTEAVVVMVLRVWLFQACSWWGTEETRLKTGQKLWVCWRWIIRKKAWDVKEGVCVLCQQDVRMQPPTYPSTPPSTFPAPLWHHSPSSLPAPPCRMRWAGESVGSEGPCDSGRRCCKCSTMGPSFVNQTSEGGGEGMSACVCVFVHCACVCVCLCCALIWPQNLETWQSGKAFCLSPQGTWHHAW